ncbi:hypothetical protein CLV24_13711 [Pontibacter ummariensis]|uniref:Outer membrane protein beta-barrel domain-containing protein n=1 Tax=Pontibacter ummariensis TaxID=1610492 RepID=A0A239LA87_9BACT|nr:hypothetical protein [Pontibacter ummariensis]PRY03984.1 hypothetical protein CLV24_13711 [Pontibacter ummariensis]SNT26454.1 hypothetical protein SAMN06296052_13712 [Pontibacter ummariensis]
MKKLLLFSFCFLVLWQARAGFLVPPVTASPGDTILIKIPVVQSERPMAVGLSIGTQGAGLEGQIPLMRQWQFRLGATVLPFSVSKDYYAFPSRATVVDMDANFAKAHFFVDWEPFAEKGTFLEKFAVSGGLAYFLTAKTKARVRLRDPYYYGDIEFSPEDAGELLVKSDWKGFAPYAGIGLNRLRLRGAMSLDLGLGAFYMPSPSVSITGTKMLEENAQNEAQLKKNLDDHFRLMPALQFSLNYNLRKNEK